MEAFCADADEFGTEEACFLDLPGVADRWRCLSLRALTAVVSLEKDVARHTTQRSFAVVLEYHGRTFQAVAKDISTGGVGLEEAPPLAPQTVVLVGFEGGHCLAGLVVWSKGARAGVKFDMPLKPSHPLVASVPA